MNTYSYIQFINYAGEELVLDEKRDSCECNVIHEDIVNKVKKTCPKKSTFMIWQSFSSFWRYHQDKILYALFASEMCVCDIAALINMTQSAVSHQLRVLKQARLVKYRKEGKVVYYSLDDDHIKQIFDQGYMHITENESGKQV